MSYQSADIYRCRNLGHRFRIVGSGNTPLKRSLECRTCTESSGNPTYVAFGDERGSFGVWRRQARDSDGDE